MALKKINSCEKVFTAFYHITKHKYGYFWFFKIEFIEDKVVLYPCIKKNITRVLTWIITVLLLEKYQACAKYRKKGSRKILQICRWP